MNRRNAIMLLSLGIVGAGAGHLFVRRHDVAHAGHPSDNQHSYKITNDMNNDPNPSTIEPISLSDEEWQQRLSQEAYYVLRKEGTERAFYQPAK